MFFVLKLQLPEKVQSLLGLFYDVVGADDPFEIVTDVCIKDLNESVRAMGWPEM